MLSLGQVLYETGERVEYCYFPTGAVVSSLYTMEDGATAEMDLVGNDGLVGTAVILGGDSTHGRAVGLIEGPAFRIQAKLLQQEFLRDGVLQRLLLRYTLSLITRISQTAVCNRLHCIEQRLCRWLLLCHDRSDSTTLHMTHEFIAHMLGGRRESVTVAAGQLQGFGLIHYCRGHIQILDRVGLEAKACECYRAVEDALDRIHQRRGTEYSHPAGVFGYGAQERRFAYQGYPGNSISVWTE
jgi:CRP-like cAMP-binding protein